MFLIVSFLNSFLSHVRELYRGKEYREPGIHKGESSG